MQNPARSRLRSASSVAVLALTAAFVAACASPQPKAMVNTKKRSKEYFAESEYGVKASPRVTTAATNLPRGGGRDQLGKPYKVRGRMYYPKEDKNYKKIGLASWYGDAFHGRLTANGEVYDMTHLTGAHPTMPLPSYARVTNIENGSSVIVRVNDRGPYSHDRLIDLSSRVAELLDYKRTGTAKVKVEYVGRAPLDGNDDSYLMASYNPGNRAPDPSDGLPTGVMVAMNGPTPSANIGVRPLAFPGQAKRAAAFPGQMLDSTSVGSTGAVALGDVVLPAFGPIAPERPDYGVDQPPPFAVAAMGYTNEAPQRATDAFAALERRSLTADSVLESWKRMQPGAAAGPSSPFIAAGSFTAPADATSLARTLSAFGRTEIEVSQDDGAAWYSVNLYSDGRQSLDDLLQAAWEHGAPDAIAVRD